MTLKTPKWDRTARYRYATFLFGVMYITLMMRWARWPDVPREVILYTWFALTTPAMIFLIWNLVQESVAVYCKRRAIDRMLDDRHPIDDSAPSCQPPDRQASERL